jgi:hypothetical protein
MNPTTREEMFMAAAGGEEVTLPKPITRREIFLAKAAGEEIELPEPITREEMFLQKIAEGGGSGGGGIVTGTYIPAEDTPTVLTPFDIVHNLGRIPTKVFMFNESTIDGVNDVIYGPLFICFTETYTRIVRNVNNSPSTTLNTFCSETYRIGSDAVSSTETTLTIKIPFTVFKFKAGQVYRWYVE